MDFSAQVNIKEELTCPICLELLTEPLSLDCGHSFCQACITANNKESISQLGGECRCPVCQSRYQLWNLRPNRQLANIVEKVREVSVRSQQQQRGDLCEHHGKIRHVFCKEDGKAICRLCVLSPEHHGHQMFSVEEVVKECQEKLQEALKKLTKEQQEAEELEADISEEKATWKNCMQTERQKILKGFDKMRGILDSEEKKEMQKLEEVEVNVLDNLAVAKDQVAQQKQYMRELISDLKCQMQGSSIDTLQDVINVIRRSESWTLKKPKIVPKKLKSTFRVPDLSGMLQGFKELTEVQSYWVDIMLNPENSLSNVVISMDQRQVKAGHCFMFRNLHSCNFSDFDAFGCQNFSSGKYYWEVDVSGKTAWILGVCRKTNNHFGKNSSGFVFNSNVNHYSKLRFDPNVNHYSKYRPENGYWVVGLRNISEYMAFEDASTSHPQVLTLFMAVPPRRVGVFLDYEAGIVSFFNVTNHGSLIYKFSRCQFSQTVYPYFNPWNCLAPMTLCQPNS